MLEYRMRQRLGLCIVLCLTVFPVLSCIRADRQLLLRDVSADQLRQMIEGKERLILVDTRTEYEYGQGHLPGAISVPPYRFAELRTLLPPDKNLEVVVYCRGYG